MITDITLRLTPASASNPTLVEKELTRKTGLKLRGNNDRASDKGIINDWRVIRKSIDARQRQVMLNLTVRVATDNDTKISATFSPVDFKVLPDAASQVIIVGAGPAGLFAALRAVELGLKPIVLERGKDVDSRRLDLATINRTKKIIPNSNYCFGEGGAGAFSDGKLFTRSKKRGNVTDILNLLHQFGASESILIDSHPHIGSDRLPIIIANIRKEIIRCGGEFYFNTQMTDLLMSGDEVIGVIAVTENENNEETVIREFKGPVILATGHSAHDVYRMLDRHDVTMEAKGIAMGVRLEHPQSLIDKIQYHSPQGRGEYLPAAEYNFVTQVDGRGVYSFCMCPGGVIVPASSSDNELVVNGMSASARAGGKANSGMVVEIRPGDFPEYTKHGKFEILELQEQLEHKFFKAAGNSIVAPAQRMKDFIEGKDSSTLPTTSYIPGIQPARLDKLFPSAIAKRLQEGLKYFGKRCHGFATNEAALIGLESRTSSPVRVPRNPETLEHIAVKNLYPAGEGAGYAGGIVSAAIDGRRCVDSLFNKLNSKDIN